MSRATQLKQESTTLFGTGVGVAALGAVGAAVGAACPLCVVAAPALVVAGAVRRWQARRAEHAGRPAPVGDAP